MLERLINLSLRHRAAVLGLVGLLVAAGLFAYSQLPIEAFPDVADTQVRLITQSSGMAPEEVEQQITQPIERNLNGLPGLTRMRSVSMFGLSLVTLTFEDGVGDYFARQQATERIAQLPLPNGVQPEMAPLATALGEVYRYFIDAPGMPLNEKKALQDWFIEPQLRTIPWVTDVNGYGGTIKQYQVRLDPNRLRAYGLTTSQVIQAIDANNGNIGGSIISHGQEAYTVRGIGLVRSIADIGAIAIAAKDGTPVLVRDVAEVGVGFHERLGIVARNEQDDIVQGIVIMRKGGNATKVCEAIQAKIDELNAHGLPPGVKLVGIYDRRDLVQNTVHTVAHNLVVGALLVFGILYLFLLNFRSSLIVATLIPISLLVAFSILHLKGIPANLLSLGAVDFGIIIDGAVVMIEAVFVRLLIHAKEGKVSGADRMAVVRGVAAEMARPIFFAKLIIICALIPIFTFQRVEGRIFAPMAWTLGSAMLGSLLLTVTLVPVLASLALGSNLKHRSNPLVDGLERAYRAVLGWVLAHPWPTLASAVLSLGAAIALGTTLGTEFLPKLDEGNIWLRTELPIATNLAQSKEVERQFRRIVLTFPEVKQIITQLGRPDDGTDAKGLNNIEASINLKPREQWRPEFHASKNELIAALNRKLDYIPGANLTFSQYIEDNVNEALSGVTGEIVAKIYGDDLKTLDAKAREIREVMARVPGVADLAVEAQYGMPQVAIRVDREACARRGISVSDVLALTQTAIGGKAAGTFYEGSRRFDITVRFEEGARDALDKIGALELSGADGRRVPLAEVAQVSIEQGAARISRERNQRRIAIKCSVRGRDQGGFVQEAQARIAREVTIPPGYQLTWEGQFENQQRATARLGIVVPLCILLIFGLLFLAFRSLKDAAMIMVNIPFALIGGIVALRLAGVNLSISAMVGFIALFGISAENGIIMVARFRQLAKEGMPLREAIVTGCLSRLRAVVMTSLMAGLGLLPAALSHGVGSEVQRPLALVIVGGMVSATALTLLVLPIIYALIEGALEKRSAVREEEVLGAGV